MATYSEIKAKLDEIARRNETNKALLERGKTEISNAAADLASMPGLYTAIISEIDQAVIDNPGVQAFEVAKSEKDQLVADFQALRTRADSMVAAVDPI